jgi:putative ABC transport system substrate-binding protein
MISRRTMLAALGVGALAAPLASLAQQRPARIPRIGYIDTSSADIASIRLDRLRAGLHDLGYAEGKNIIVEVRWAETRYERLPALTAELLKQELDMIVAAGPAAIQVVQRATTTVPVVIVASGDPLAFGFVASLSRPGGNITGLSPIGADLSSKYLELLRVAIPKLSRVAVLMNPGHPRHPDYLKNIQAAAQTTGVTVLPVQAGTPSQIGAAFGVTKRDRAGALIVLGDGLFFSEARRIAELAVQQRLPTMFSTREPVESGGLMSYGPNLAEQFYRAATYVDKILKGAKPADLPVEQPTTIELVINLKTAKAIGLAIPQELLLRADRVIE